MSEPHHVENNDNIEKYINLISTYKAEIIYLVYILNTLNYSYLLNKTNISIILQNNPKTHPKVQLILQK